MGDIGAEEANVEVSHVTPKWDGTPMSQGSQVSNFFKKTSWKKKKIMTIVPLSF